MRAPWKLTRRADLKADPLKEDHEPSEILPGTLFLGSAKHAKEAGVGKNKHGFTHLINVCDALVVLPGLSPSGVIAEWVPIKDAGTDDVFGEEQSDEELEKALAANPAAPMRGAWWRCRRFLESALRKQGNRILVHCALGVNRSATIVIAWLMETRRWTARAALDYVQDRRWYVNPAPLHRAQLKVFQEKHLGIPLEPDSDSEESGQVPSKGRACSGMDGCAIS
jgi:dual specificity phosphatase 12